MGTLKVIIHDNLDQCEIEGYGHARVSYGHMTHNSMGINYIQVPNHTETAHNIYTSLKNKGVKGIIVRKNEIEWGKKTNRVVSGFSYHPDFDPETGEPYDKGDLSAHDTLIRLTDAQKKTIEAAHVKRMNEIADAIIAGRTRVYIQHLGCDFVYPALKFDGVPINLTYYVEEMAGIMGVGAHADLSFIPDNLKTEGTDVTKFVADMLTAARLPKEENPAFAKARATGVKVLINKMVLPEYETPLRGDGEGDMVDVLTYAMPDGTTETKYVHNY